MAGNASGAVEPLLPVELGAGRIKFAQGVKAGRWVIRRPSPVIWPQIPQALGAPARTANGRITAISQPRDGPDTVPACVIAPPKVRHQITQLFGRTRACLSERLLARLLVRVSSPGGGLEDDMMAGFTDSEFLADAALWALLAFGIIFIALGCHMTRRPAPKVVEQPFEAQLDKAA
jgi:hypothetical protein